MFLSENVLALFELLDSSGASFGQLVRSQGIDGIGSRSIGSHMVGHSSSVEGGGGVIMVGEHLLEVDGIWVGVGVIKLIS